MLDAKTRSDQVLLTLAERESREFLMMSIADTTYERALEAMKQLHETCSEHFDDVFRTISADNGFELSDLSNLEKAADTLVAFAHSYTSCDKEP